MKTPSNNFKLIGLAVLVLLVNFTMAQQSNIYGKIGQNPSPNLTETGPILWDQIDVPGPGFILDQEFTNPENSSESSIAADDFYVPEGDSWEIGSIAWVGTFWDYGVGPVDTFNVIFYDDAPGLPGTEIYEFYDVTAFTYEEEIVNDYTVVTYKMKLPTTVSLDEGHYWMSVQAKGSLLTMGKWGWNDYWAGSVPAIENQWHWKNPEDGLGNGYIDWTPAVTVAAIFLTYDLTFALYEPAFENDMALVEILSPLGGEELTTTEPVTVVIKNEGTTPQTGFNMKYVFNGEEVIENVGALNVNPNEFYEFTFAETVDMFTAGPYELEVAVMLANDEYTDNDMQDTTVYSYGTVYIMENGVTNATITTCSGTSVDMGGIDGPFAQTDFGTVTFYPESAGSQLRLTFLEFDIQWGEMELFDGENTSAPSFGIFDKGTGSPGVITAWNETGALTMKFEASGWDFGPGWVAFVSCFDPVEDDFAVLDISLSSNSITQGEFVTAYATIQNFGTLTQGKDVTFTSDGIEFGTTSTGDLEPWEIVTVEAEWNPMDEGIFTIMASVPEDEGIDDNNSQAMLQEVLSNAFLIEGFENETFPPEGWSLTTGLWTRSTSGPLFGIAHATAFNTPSMPDTLITPMLEILADDVISFYAGGSWWWPGDLEIVYKEASSDTWVSLEYLAGFSIPVSPTNYVIDLNDYAGEDGQIGFVTHGNVAWWDIGEIDLDEIYGPKIKGYDNNLQAFDFDGDPSPNANEPAIYEFVVKNLGSEAQDAGVYTVKLMDSEGMELTSMDGLEILPLQELTYELEYIFTETGPITVYGYVDFPDDDLESDNTSESMTPFVQQEGTQQTQIGNGIQETWNYPLGTSGAYRLSEMLYLNDEIGLSGSMNGIGFFYRSEESLTITGYPVDVYVGETLEEELPAGTDWITSADLELVFSGTVDLFPGDNMVFIPFDTPYAYGGDNLVVMTYKTDTDYHGNTMWYLHATTGMQTKWASEYNFVPDPADPSPLYPHDEYLRPNARIYVLPLQGGYCEPQTIDGTDNGYYVDGVTLGTIENTATGGQGDPDYNDYTTMSTNLEKSKYNEITLEVNTGGNGGSVAVWIDYNSDSDFDDEGEKIAQVSGEGDFVVSLPVVVPEGTGLGIKRLRIRGGDFTNHINSCETIYNGEAEDYLVNVTETIQVFNPVADFSAELDGTEVNLMWGVPVNPGQAYFESFETFSWPMENWEIKTSTSLTDPLTDPVEMSWEQTNETDFVYNGNAAAYCSADAPDFNWLISPEFGVYGDDAIRFGINYTSDAGGYSKFYALLEVDGVWMTVVEYTDETTWENHYDEMVTVDISEYAGKMVRLAFVTENNSAYPVAIDDAIISSISNLTEEYEGITAYKLYKNGEMIAEIDDPSVVTYTDVVDVTENYTYCVVAVYNEDESESMCEDVFFLMPLTPPVNLVGFVDYLDVALNWTAPNAGIMRFNDDFEAYTAGEQVALQNPDDWTTWGGDPGGAEDPFITTDNAYSGDNSVVIEDLADLLWLHDEALTSGHYNYNFKLNIPEGHNAYFNVLQYYEFGVGAEWGFQAFFDQNGNGYIDAGGQTATYFTYEYDKWMYVQVDVDLDSDWGEFYIDGEFIWGWQWSTGIFGGSSNNQLMASDFYAWNANGTPKYYIDDVNLMEVFDAEELLSYNVYRDEEVIGTVTSDEYADLELEIGTYEYYVTAIYDEGESDPSNTVSLTTMAPPYLPFFEDFEWFVAGEQVACQDPVNWTTWSYLPCDDVEDAYISDAQAYSGDNSIVVVSDNDLVLPFEEYYTEGTYKASFWMYVPTDKDAYWNVLQDFAGGTSTWGLEVFFDGGTGTISVDPDASFEYSFDTWMLMELYVDLDEDGAQLFVDGESVHFWSWTNGGINQFAAFDFYGMVGFYGEAEFYLDDMMIEVSEWTMPVLPAPINLTGEAVSSDVHLDWIAPVGGDLTEIAYDDGTSEGTWWIGNPTTSSDMMTVRMTMPEDGTIYEVALGTSSTGGADFNDVIICADDGSGLPDLNAAYENFGVTNVSAASVEWLFLTLTSPFSLTAGEDFWVVVNWPDGNDNGPFIGGDNTTPPTEDRNYWSNTAGVWNLWADDNFMMRSYYAPMGESYNGSGLQVIPVENPGDLTLPVSSLSNPVVTESTGSWKTPVIITATDELLGYNVYRDDVMIANTEEVMYDDMGLPVGQYEYYVTALYDLGESDPSNTVLIDVEVGVDQIELEGMNIYPNPVIDRIYIESPETISRVILLNANGQVVVEEDVTDDVTLSIDVDDLNTGIYYLRIETAKGWINEKIIKN